MLFTRDRRLPDAREDGVEVMNVNYSFDERIEDGMCAGIAMDGRTSRVQRSCSSGCMAFLVRELPAATASFVLTSPRSTWDNESADASGRPRCLPRL